MLIKVLWAAAAFALFIDESEVRAAASAAPRAVSQVMLTLDGKGAGLVKSVAGGGISAAVVSVAAGSTNVFKKHLANPTFEDFAFQVGITTLPSLFAWVDASWAQSPSRKNGVVVECDAARNAISERQFSNALISEVTLPALDGSSKDAAFVTVKVAPELTRSQPGTGSCDATVDKSPKAWSAGNFRVELAGIDTTGVARVDAFTVKRAIATADVGAARQQEKEPGKLELPNLKLYVAMSKAQDFQSWFDDFVVKGNSGESQEKSGALVYLAANGQDELARVTLQNVGIFRSAPRDAQPSAERGAEWVVELYVESMRLSIGGVANTAATPVLREPVGKALARPLATPAKR